MLSPLIEVASQPLVFESPSAVARLGLLVLSTDLTTERDYRRVFDPAGPVVHVARVPFDNPTTPENLRQMRPRLQQAAALLPAGLQAIAYSCTSASVVIGDQAVSEAIARSHPAAPVVTPSWAAVCALRALKVTRMSLLTPYLPETTVPFVPYFQAQGFAIERALCLGLDDDRQMARLSAESLMAAAQAADHPDSQAVFISCTGLPVMTLVPELEARLGKPVVTSNQASSWMMRSYAPSVPNAISSPPAYGQLFCCAFAPSCA